jgi:hypothetical protein
VENCEECGGNDEQTDLKCNILATQLILYLHFTMQCLIVLNGVMFLTPMCYQIKLKFEEVLLELSLAKEIIKLMQEERNFNVSTGTSNANHGLESDQFNNKFDNWAKVPSNRSKRSRKSHMQYPQPIPMIINHFAPLHNLSNLNEDSNAVKIMEEAIEVNGKKKQKSQSSNLDNKTKPSQPLSTIGTSKRMVKVYNNKAGNKRNHKLVIMGDSHSRGLAKEVKNHLSKNFEVIGLVKPGTGAEIIVNSAMSDIANLTKSDVVVFCGGSNDVRTMPIWPLNISQILLRLTVTQTSSY